MPKARGLKKTGGRKKGTPNKKTAALVKAAGAGGVMPLEYMLNVMRQPIPQTADPVVKATLHGLRFEAAKAAAPYVHPRLAAIEHTGPDGRELTAVSIHVVGVQPGSKR